MDMQQMSMNNGGHTVFWREDQVAVLFHSDKALIVDGMLKNDPLNEIHLRQYVEQLSNFLKQRGVPVTLHFLGDSNHAMPMPMPMSQDIADMSQMANAFPLPDGVYAFGFSKPIESEFGPIGTSVISFLQIEQHASQNGSSPLMGMPPSNPDGNGNGKNGSMSIIPLIVNTLNENLNELNGGQVNPDESSKELNGNGNIPITIATPAWLSGGTPSGGTQGCPLSPPLPVKDFLL